MCEYRNCGICGKLFVVSNSKAKYCSEECRIKARREREKLYYSSIYNSEKKKERKPENRLVELAMKAREKGMSYGQYMALEYAEKHPIIRQWW